MTVEQRKRVARSVGAGAAKTGVGAFGLAVLIEVGLIPSDLGPNTMILLTWFAGQVLYGALTPSQWHALLGDRP